MSKKKKLRKPIKSTAKAAIITDNGLGLPEYGYALIGLAIFIAYYIFSTQSVGYYTHDEVSHFLNMQDFWVDWTSVLSVWSKPGYKFTYILPSALGATAVVLTNCFYAAFAAYITGLTAKEFGIKDRALVMILAAFIPMLYQIAFRNYAELVTALVLALTIYFYKKEKFIIAAIFASYLFPLRQEMALVGVFMGVLFLLRKQFLPIIALASAPIILNLVGWAGTGDPLFLLSSLSGGTGDYQELGFFHLWRVFMPAIGVATTLLFVIGILGFFVHKDGWLAYLKKYEILYIGFLPVFLFSCLVTEPLFTPIKLGANWKQLVQLAPAIALFAGLGFSFIRQSDNKKYFFYTLGISIVLALLTLAYFSYGHNYVFYNNEKEYTKITVLILAIIACFGLPKLNIAYKYIGLILGALTIAHTLYTETPIPLAPEDAAMAESANWIKSNNLESRPKIFNTHPIFNYYMGNTARERLGKYQQTPLAEDLEKMPAGTLIVWDSHYSTRRSRIEMSYFQNNPKYKLLFQKLTENQRFYVAIFEKV